MKVRFTAIFAVSLLLVSAARAQEQRYMAIFLDDTKVGHVVGRQVEADGTFTVGETVVMELRRGETAVTVSVRYESVETDAGKPVRFWKDLQLGAMGNMKVAGEVRDGVIHLTTEQMGFRQTSEAPFPEDALMPGAVLRYQRAQGLAPGTHGTFVAFDPISVAGTPTEYVVGDRQTVNLIGSTTEAHEVRVTQRMGLQPVVSRLYVDEEFNVYAMNTEIMGMRVRMVACDEAYAKSPNGRFDLLTGPTIHSSVRIDDPRDTKAARMTLRRLNDQAPLDLVESACQRVVEQGVDSMVIDRSVVRPSGGQRPYAGDDPEALAALKSNPYVQSDHRQVVAQAERIISAGAGAGEAAKAVEQWVAGHISNKTMSVGYASALEAMQNRTGDCSEHAVLTAALCRAAGVPCRIVLGAVYADDYLGQNDIFLGHAWNQVYVDGEWVDIDAALGMDASRVALAVGQGEPLEFISIVNSLGSLEVTAFESR